jgi:hypothetical protein
MKRSSWLTAIFSVFLIAAGACSKHPSAAQVIVEIPSGFTGDFILEMGVKEAPPLEKRGDAYVVSVPRNGKVTTSTLLTNSQPTFRSSTEGAVWGYSHSVFSTGDGIPVGGKIEFFVGTKKEYEAEQGKKNHSGGFSSSAESTILARNVESGSCGPGL